MSSSSRGRIDRVDAGPEGVIVRDYKGRSPVDGAERWLAKGKLQMGLYVRAVQQLLGRTSSAGCTSRSAARSCGRAGSCSTASTRTSSSRGRDRMAPEQVETLLAEIEAAALEAVREIRAGRLEPRPETCGWKGDGCSYPSICRCARS